jgi:hypothetical protein
MRKPRIFVWVKTDPFDEQDVVKRHMKLQVSSQNRAADWTRQTESVCFMEESHRWSQEVFAYCRVAVWKG